MQFGTKADISSFCFPLFFPGPHSLQLYWRIRPFLNGPKRKAEAGMVPKTTGFGKPNWRIFLPFKTHFFSNLRLSIRVTSEYNCFPRAMCFLPRRYLRYIQYSVSRITENYWLFACNLPFVWLSWYWRLACCCKDFLFLWRFALTAQ